MNRSFIPSMIILMVPINAYSACDTIMSVINRPSNIDSPCSIPFKKVVTEFNLIQEQLADHLGNQRNYPNALLRIGLPAYNELFINLPDYISQSSTPESGSTLTSAGLKQSFSYKEQWLFALEEIFYAPTGSYAYGAQKAGGAINGIISYSFSEKLNVAAMLGVAHLSLPPLENGLSYNSLSPDICLSYSPDASLSLYAEIYGQSKIDAINGAGFNIDGGFIVLINPNAAVNLSAGQQIYNTLGGFNHYINVGISLMLG